MRLGICSNVERFAEAQPGRRSRLIVDENKGRHNNKRNANRKECAAVENQRDFCNECAAERGSGLMDYNIKEIDEQHVASEREMG